MHPTVPRHSDGADHRPQPPPDSDQTIGKLNAGSAPVVGTQDERQQGAKLEGKPKGPCSIRGVTGKGQTGRVNRVNLR